MKFGAVLEELHRSESALYAELLQLSQRYLAEHEVHYVARDLSQWSRDHVVRLAEVAVDYGQTLDSEISDPRASKHAREESHRAAFGVDNPSGLALLWDLRSIYMAAGGVSMQWTMLSQGAQAAHKSDLLTVIETCQSQTMRQMSWAQAQIKSLSARIVVS